MPHCTGQWVAQLPRYTAALQGQWAVDLLRHTTALHGAVGNGPLAVHCHAAWGQRAVGLLHLLINTGTLQGAVGIGCILKVTHCPLHLAMRHCA